MFQLASVGLALIFELAQPIGLSDATGHDALQRLYEPVTEQDRASRIAFVVSAGGEL